MAVSAFGGAEYDVSRSAQPALRKPGWLNRRFEQSVPILTYHSLNVLENSYSKNDHIAFESDLETIHKLGFRIIPLGKVLDWHQGKCAYKEVKNGVALTMDDGSWLDFYDVQHPTCHAQSSMFNIIKGFQDSFPGIEKPEVHATSFVISSPQARVELDEKNLIGKGWWGDEWWSAANKSGLMAIECHSWDHVHPLLDKVAQEANIKGNFAEIDTLADCTAQVTRAAEYIELKSGKRPSLFAYPWGQASRYMVEQFMPNHQADHQFRAAFSIQPKHLDRHDNTWFLPRYVCGRDWDSPEGLTAILKRRQNGPIA